VDRLRAMEVLVAVADTGGLARAARALSISPPSVTRLINDLEAELGVTLLHRTTRRVTLTGSGEAFLADARQIVEDYRTASEAARGAFCQPTGQLRVTAPTLFGQHYVTPILTEFLDRYSDVSVDTAYLDRVVSLTDEGFDVAFRIGALPDSALKAVRVGSVRRVVCGCPSYFRAHGLPQAPRDLAKHRVLAARPVTPTDEWRFADQLSVRVRPRLSFNSVPAAIAATLGGWGLSRVLSYQIGPDLGSGGLQTVLSEFEPDPLPVHILHGEGRRASAKVRTFVDLAKERLRANPYIN